MIVRGGFMYANLGGGKFLAKETGKVLNTEVWDNFKNNSIIFHTAN